MGSSRNFGQLRTGNGRIADGTLGIQTFVAATYESATIMKNTSVDADLMGALHKRRGRLQRRDLRRWMMPMLVGVCVSVGAFAQTAATQKKARSASPAAEITRFFLEEPKKDSGYETGPLHIVFNDGAEVVKTLPPLRASTEKEVVFNAVGFSGVQLAADRQTLGWTINVENCCTSYSIPLSLAVFRHKRVLHTFDQGQMIWSWIFVQGGEHVAIVFGPTHGPEVGDYRLYNLTTGKLISEVWGDEETQALKSNAPEWAKLLQDHLHNR
ncbi:MAG: hypothetical protein JO097_11760 [Acidobacteriaceae bacterium]|nr:hypothetical protein [Acidobacteriaceae bacterium]MBV9296184.1 hypothetical protein [Acidobacteriaceae bacterium]MBV9763439.1 hypothetical protein [Acidobacteriaceae bacterium]